MSAEGFTVWLTGMTGSGKSTLAGMLHDQLVGLGYPCEVLDSGRIRQTLNRSLGFSREEIETNLLRLAYESKLLNGHGVIAIVAAVSPYRAARDRIRADLGRFIEVYCRCPLEVLVKRDRDGLFERAQRDEVAHVAGINAPYEEPFKPEVLLNTEIEPPEACLRKMLSTLRILGHLPDAPSSAYTAEEEETIKQRLQDLGYI
ncbi:MAG: adenylyl-sulfate kinase [Planctomycetota bacterium]